MIEKGQSQLKEQRKASMDKREKVKDCSYSAQVMLFLTI